MKTSIKSSFRWDQADSYFLSQQLEQVDPTIYYDAVPGIVGRRVIPKVPNVTADLPVYKYARTVLKGNARKTGPRGKDATRVDVTRIPSTAQILPVETEMTYTVDDVRASRAAGLNLPTEQQQAAVNAIEQKIDDLLCNGDSATGRIGIASIPSVNSTDAQVKDGSTGRAWNVAGADPTKILGDISGLLMTASAQLKQAQVPGSDVPAYDQFVLMLPVDRYTLLMTTILNPTGGTPITLLNFIEQSYRQRLKAIVPWWRLSTADTVNSNGPLAVLAPALDNGSINPMACGALLPLDFESLDPQYHGRNVTIPAAGFCGGIAARSAVAFQYLRKI